MTLHRTVLVAGMDAARAGVEATLRYKFAEDELEDIVRRVHAAMARAEARLADDKITGMGRIVNDQDA